MAKKKKVDHTPKENDDGTRWQVMDHATRTQIYVSQSGTTKDQAERLARGMVRPAYIEQIS